MNMSAYDEVVAIVDQNDVVIGSEKRSEMRLRHLIHRATFILVFNSKGQLFVQKRSLSKDLYPGYYDLTTGGVVLADEGYNISAKRELEEELGISGTPLESLFDFYFETADNKVWGRVFKCIFDGAITLQEEEIESGGFYTLEEIEKLIKTEPVAPESLYVFKRYFGIAG